MDVLVDLNEVLGADWMKENVSEAACSALDSSIYRNVYNLTLLKNAGVTKVPDIKQKLPVSVMASEVIAIRLTLRLLKGCP
jgi:multiple sugar transport system substrate-binding protein